MIFQIDIYMRSNSSWYSISYVKEIHVQINAVSPSSNQKCLRYVVLFALGVPVTNIVS